MGAVVGVVGGSGGVGASVFAAVLAAVAASVAGEALLVDVDVAGGGVDVLLGIERADGARWSDLQLAGGRLEPEALLAGLPRWGGCAVLAADAGEIDPEAIRQVIEVAAARTAVVLDLPRTSCPERAAALLGCDLVVVVTRGDATGLVAAHAVVGGLPELPVGAVVRRGPVPAAEAARLVPARLLGELPPCGRAFELRAERLPRPARAVAAGVLSGLRAAG